ncbi:hypothetical protein Rruber_00234 [Rhodococcus ruber]|uniref:hypothetical protein n=1 Tax=Rhodococcus ruber TaxID=1830 RepID=UPI00315C5CD7
MINQHKLDDQAEGYVWVDGYAALPLSGPGRWMTYPDGTTIYTDDATKLFVKNKQGTTIGLVEAVGAIRELFKAGKTVTEAFEALRNGAPVTTGDLSELA